MTNYEKNKELLETYAISDVAWGVDESGKVIRCGSLFTRDCSGCIFRKKNDCAEGRLKWIQQEYKESEVDWTKVEVDTLILVKDYEDAKWHRGYFAGYIGGTVCTFDIGSTSENFMLINRWNYAKLAEEEM